MGRFYRRKKTFRALKFLAIPLALVFVWFVIHTVVIVYDGLSDGGQKADAAVVLGNFVFPNGTPSYRLKGRLDRALELYRQGRVKLVIVSGGIDSSGTNEAVAMRKYLFKNGVPLSSIVSDDTGKNTRASALFVKSYAEDHDLKSFIIVSQYYHISRAKLAFRKEGMFDVSGACARTKPEIRDLYSVPREFIAYYSYLIK